MTLLTEKCIAAKSVTPRVYSVVCKLTNTGAEPSRGLQSRHIAWVRSRLCGHRVIDWSDTEENLRVRFKQHDKSVINFQRKLRCWKNLFERTFRCRKMSTKHFSHGQCLPTDEIRLFRIHSVTDRGCRVNKSWAVLIMESYFQPSETDGRYVRPFKRTVGL